MDIEFKVTIRVDPARWAAREGLGEDAKLSEVRRDVREYMLNILESTHAVEDTDMIIWRRW